MQIFWSEETIFFFTGMQEVNMHAIKSVSQEEFLRCTVLDVLTPKDVIAVLTLCPERAFISACLIMYCCHGLIKYLLFFYLLTSCVFFPLHFMWA